ncbi:hypothetical protein STENM223S_08247 [Streptomyces tendae]
MQRVAEPEAGADHQDPVGARRLLGAGALHRVRGEQPPPVDRADE